MPFFTNFGLETYQWGLALICALIFGVSKAGIKGIAIIAIPLMAIAFGGKASTGIVLPMLIMGDIFAVFYYSRYAQWKYLWKLLPWVLSGVLVGVWVGDKIPAALFKQIMASIILLSVGVLFWWDRQKVKHIPDRTWFGATMGLLVGFTTMVGNLAGPFANIFFLAMQLPKEKFIGTTAWLFFIVNLFKVPFHIFVWQTITLKSFMLDLTLLPGIILGLFIGIRLVKYIKEHHYRQMILVLTAIGAILIFIR